MPDLFARVAERFDASHDFAFGDSCLMLCFVGSQSHGTYTPPDDPDAIDDVDLMGVVLPPARYLVGLDHFEHWTAQWEELDVVIYSFHKFVHLLLKQNPNVLGTLWLRDEDYLLRGRAWYRLAGERALFATRAAHGSFAGYANGQLSRMESYSPAIHAEQQALETKLEAAGWKISEVMDGRSLPMPKGISAEEASEAAARVKHIRAKFHAAYMGDKRKRLVLRHGYDTKNAAHLIRLLRMCIEFLGDGEMRVHRASDAEELKEIKRGEWALERVKEKAQTLFAAAKVARDNSPLPYEPDHAAASRLVTEITLEALKDLSL